MKTPDETQKLSENECIGMVAYEEDLYYINADDNYSLYKISLSAGTEEQIDQRGFSCLDIVGDCLYLLQPNVGYVRILLK
ncbi:MAG: DUF5050 domain-containing protein [Erysipelotrichaceae bacterium]|nr:DUF5050 domain-containing protein [Erysipelotrichaceae bacterium]